MPLGDVAQRVEQPDDIIAAERVVNLQPFLAAAHQTGLAQLLQVLGCVGHRQPGYFRQFVYAALTLGNIFQ